MAGARGGSLAASPTADRRAGGQELYFYILGGFPAQGEFIASQTELHGIAQGGHADQLDHGTGCQAHIQEPAPHFTLALDIQDPGALFNSEFIKEHDDGFHTFHLVAVGKEGMGAPVLAATEKIIGQ